MSTPFDLEEIRSWLNSLSDKDFKTVFDSVTTEQSRRSPKVRLKPARQRLFQEYQDARNIAVTEGQELPPLTAELVAEGRQFRLTDGQLKAAEEKFGKLAHREVVLYATAWNATDDTLLGFSCQCLLQRERRRTSGACTAFAIADANEFFIRAAEYQRQLDETIVEDDSTKKKKKKSIKTSEEFAKDLLNSLGL
jgi:hypothetical protein